MDKGPSLPLVNGDVKKTKRNGDASVIINAQSAESFQSVIGPGPCKKLKISGDIPDPSKLSVNPAYLQDDFKDSVRKLVKLYGESTSNLTNVPLSNNAPSSMVFRKPFRHMIFPDFLHGPVDQLESTLLSQKFSSLGSDLYQLSQTRELSLETVEDFSTVTDLFKGDIRPWVQDITGMELREHVDIRGAIYRYTDYLVCHDDRLTTRKVAYVYYLTENEWTADDGGTLDLFDSVCVDDNVVPGEISKSILPKRNTLVLFVVSGDSFHQVSEVLSLKKPRLSLTGWFHTPVPPVPEIIYRDSPEVVSVQIHEVTEYELEICACQILVNEDEETEHTKAVLSKEFQKAKRVTLDDVFTPTFYSDLLSELRRKDRSLPWITPANRNEAGSYKYLDLRHRVLPKEPDNLDVLLRMVLTEQFLQSLTEITGIHIRGSMHTITPQLFPIRPVLNIGTSTPAWYLKTIQLRLERFEHRSYTLKTFEDVQQGEALDIFYFIGTEKLDSDCGGTIYYIDIQDKDPEALHDIEGKANSIDLILRDETTVFYTDYVNHRWVRRNDSEPFYRLWMSIPWTDVEVGPKSRSDGSSDAESSSSSADEVDVGNRPLDESNDDEDEEEASSVEDEE